MSSSSPKTLSIEISPESLNISSKNTNDPEKHVNIELTVEEDFRRIKSSSDITVHVSPENNYASAPEIFNELAIIVSEPKIKSDNEVLFTISIRSDTIPEKIPTNQLLIRVSCKETYIDFALRVNYKTGGGSAKYDKVIIVATIGIAATILVVGGLYVSTHKSMHDEPYNHRVLRHPINKPCVMPPKIQNPYARSMVYARAF